MVEVEEVTTWPLGGNITASTDELVVAYHAGRSARVRLTAFAASISVALVAEDVKSAAIPPPKEASSTASTTTMTPVRCWRRRTSPPWATTTSRQAS